MISETMLSALRDKNLVLASEMDERTRRLWAATEAVALGYGGISAVAEVTGMALSTICIGMRELREEERERGGKSRSAERRIRRRGAGRKPLTETDPRLLNALEALVEPTTRGDPMSPLRWTCKSTRNLAEELQRQGHVVSHETVAQMLHDLDYSLQGNRKTREGTSHPDRNAQFEHLNAKVREFQRYGQPVISVDGKKKELVGDFKNGGREWRPQGDAVKVRTHDFEDQHLGKVSPYGVYDVTHNNGWMSVGIDHDTAEFAVETIHQWWRQMGCRAYPEARELLITADSGGSNSSRARLWKVALQKLADETGLKLGICHYPPGTSKWNKIEHRMFCHVTRNWRGRPLESREIIVNLISNTTTTKGLRIQAALDLGSYPKGIEVSDEDLAQVCLKRDLFHGDWNYTILPQSPKTL